MSRLGVMSMGGHPPFQLAEVPLDILERSTSPANRTSKNNNIACGIFKRGRGFFGKVFKFLFIAFNCLMLVWLASYWFQAGDLYNANTSHAYQTGAAVGLTIGTGLIFFFWAAGALILGLLTMLSRGSKLIIEETAQ
jgi:hypothetical protein